MEIHPLVELSSSVATLSSWMFTLIVLEVHLGLSQKSTCIVLEVHLYCLGSPPAIVSNCHLLLSSTATSIIVFHCHIHRLGIPPSSSVPPSCFEPSLRIVHTALRNPIYAFIREGWTIACLLAMLVREVTIECDVEVQASTAIVSSDQA
jgi:hypothetical protein